MPLVFCTLDVLRIRMFQFYWTSPTKVRLRFLMARYAPLPATFQGNKDAVNHIHCTLGTHQIAGVECAVTLGLTSLCCFLVLQRKLRNVIHMDHTYKRENAYDATE